MMTTMAYALLGTLPIALGWGAGGEARKRPGAWRWWWVALRIFSQLMTLYLTPVVYTYMAAIVSKWDSWKARKGRKSHKVLAPAMQGGD